jgi:hypothetical protein
VDGSAVKPNHCRQQAQDKIVKRANTGAYTDSSTQESGVATPGLIILPRIQPGPAPPFSGQNNSTSAPLTSSRSHAPRAEEIQI